MTFTTHNARLKLIADVASAAFLVIPPICGLWLFILFHASKNGHLSIDSTPTIFGRLPAPLEIIFVDFIPFMAGWTWLLYRCAPALSARYPVIKTRQFRVLAWISAAMLIVSAKILYDISRGAP